MGGGGLNVFHADKKTEKPEKAVNGEDKTDSGVETQNSEGNADEECDPLGPNCYYDKSKSFFDNISCDDTRSVCPAVIIIATSYTTPTPLTLIYPFSPFPGKRMTNLEAQVSHGKPQPFCGMTG